MPPCFHFYAYFHWDTQCKEAFDGIKSKLLQASVLQGPNWELPFHINTDASDKALGAVLGQQEDKDPYAIYYISKNLAGAELNYTVTEKELIAVVYAINKLRHYIKGYQVFVHTDHSAIRYFRNKTDTSSRVIRWLLLLPEFDITILDKPGK